MISQHDFALNCQKALYSQLDLPIYDEAGTLYSQTGVPHPLLNGVLRSTTTDANIADIVQKVIAHFKKLELPHSWWVEAREAPQTLRSLLEREGLNYLGNFSVMVIDLSTPHTLTEFKTKSEDVDVVIVDGNESNLFIWGEILGRSFQVSKAAMTIFLDLMKKAGQTGSFTNVLALKDGKGVATGSLTYTKDGAYICSDSTLEDERNLGYGKAVTEKLLRIASKSGCKRVAVISSPLDADDYKSLGFIEEGTFQIYSNSF